MKMKGWMDESMNGWMDVYMKIQQKLIEYYYDEFGNCFFIIVMGKFRTGYIQLVPSL